MREIAQVTLPDGTVVNNPNNFRSDFRTLGDVLSAGYELVIYIAGFLMLIWMFWGVFEYIFASGDKTKLGKARARITYSIVGFILVIAAFLVSDYIKDFAKPTDITPTNMEAPKAR